MQTPKSRVYVLLDSESRVLRLEGEYSLPADLTDGRELMKALETSTRSRSHYSRKAALRRRGSAL